MKEILVTNSLPGGGVAVSTSGTEYKVEARGGELTVSDGSHTFEELYEHRFALFIALCRMLKAGEFDGPVDVWRSKFHNDNTMYEGWFILGINEEAGRQITYHLPMRLWAETSFAAELAHAPKWDGHSPSDVLDRLKLL